MKDWITSNIPSSRVYFAFEKYKFYSVFLDSMFSLKVLLYCVFIGVERKEVLSWLKDLFWRLEFVGSYISILLFVGFYFAFKPLGSGFWSFFGSTFAFAGAFC